MVLSLIAADFKALSLEKKENVIVLIGENETKSGEMMK